MLRIAVLASGRGSNLQALIEAIDAGRLDARIVGVFSDRPGCEALARAERAGVPTVALPARRDTDRLGFDEQMFSRVDAVHPDVIVFAGYMRVVSKSVVEARLGRMINIHPSLLPAFKGLRTHEQAIAADVREHGASVHVVSAELDGGPVVSQAKVPVLAGDDPATLAQRVLAREHVLLVETLRLLARGELALQGGSVSYAGVPLAAPLQLDALDQLHPTQWK